MIGHMRNRCSPLVLATLLALFAAAPAAAKSYSADRFDSVIRVLADGTLDVTETVVFRFEEGTFTEVFREIPLRRTDGVEVVLAELQGRRLPFGTERGTVEVRERGSRVRVVWRFGPVEGVTREFVLNYRVRGVVRREETADVLAWRATPGEHRYVIRSSRIELGVPVAPEAPPVLRSRKVGASNVALDGNRVRVAATDIRENGWIDVALSFPRGVLIESPPAWQQHALDVSAQSAMWIVGAAVVALAGFILLFAWRQSYDAPPRDLEWTRGESLQTAPPEAASPAVAGALAANGRATLEHAMAALFGLAERGEIDIAETRGMLGQRDFRITRRRVSGSIREYEQAVLDVIFKGPATEGSTVSLSQARSRLGMRAGTFSRAMTRELLHAGLIDESRKAVRDRYNRAAIWFLVLGVIAFAPAGLLVGRYGGWPMLIPASVLLLALLSVIFAATITPLTNEGVRRAHRWREYRKHLDSVARGKRVATDDPAQVTLAFAVALGLASAWSKFLKQRGAAAPAWFHALPGTDHHAAFPAFIASGGAGAGGGVHGGGGGGSAGGGASGAH